MTAYAYGEQPDLSHDFQAFSLNQPVDSIVDWNNAVVDPMDPNFVFNTYQHDFGFETGSQYDNSSYAYSSAAPSEVDYGHNGTSHNAYYDQSSKATRRQSVNRSMAPQVRSYDSAYYSNNTLSPNMDYIPGYHQSSQDFNQDYFINLDQAAPESPQALSDEETSASSIESITPPRSHPLYNVGPNEDGLYHCPYAATEDCGHEPKQLKCEYDKYIDSHLKPFRCRHDKCSDLQFSSTACLLRHEREAHEMHGHEESLCEYPPCNRSLPGNGFRRSYNCKDHMARCHGWMDHNPQDGKKRKSGANGVGKATKTKTTAKVTSKKQQIAHLRDEWANRKAHLEELTRNLSADGPLFAIALTQINAETQTLKSIQTELSKLTGRMIR